MSDDPTTRSASDRSSALGRRHTIPGHVFAKEHDRGLDHAAAGRAVRDPEAETSRLEVRVPVRSRRRRGGRPPSRAA